MSAAVKTQITSDSKAAKRTLLGERLRQVARERRHRPLSFAQQRLWFLDQLEPNSPLYNVATVARVEGALDPEALEEAINAVVSRHETLRTHFVRREEDPEQVIEPNLKVKLDRRDLSANPQSDIEARRIINEEVNRPFDLSAGPLIRPTLLTLKPNKHKFVLVLHHIVADEWSLKAFFNELAHFYRARVQGGNGQVPELPIQYADYAEWQRDWLQQGNLQKQLEYWKACLGNNPPATELLPDRPRSTANFRGATAARCLSPQLSRQAGEFARQKNATLFMVLLAAFKALLCRHTQQEDILIGSPIAGRGRAETEHLIGFFVNTLVLRTSLAGNPTFEALLERVREVTLGAYANQDLPFEKIVEELHPERSLNQIPFTRIMFLLQNGVVEKLEFPAATFHFEYVESETAKFDLTFLAQETSGGLVLHAEYNRDLFESGTISRLLEHFEVLLGAAVSAPATQVSELPLLTEAERHKVLIDWNQTRSDYPREKCLHQLFEAQAEGTPGAIAITFGDSSITYGELNSRANQLASYLRQFQVGPDVPVCICVHRSIAMVTGVLGILKAGGAYVPLDARYPKDRLSFMLQDTKPPVLLTQQDLLARLPSHPGKIICLDTDWELIAREGKQNVSSAAGAENLAYIMYTSGSTGRPKGVAVPHRAVNRLVLNTNYIQLDSTDRIGQVSNFSFDAATFEIWGALLNGAELVGITRDVALSPKEFAQELKHARITAMFLTSALFNQLAAEVPGAFENMRTLMAGGEALDPKWVSAVLTHRPPRRLVNGYGPTENTTFTCCHLIEELSDSATSVPIGRPISNTQAYILDRHLNPVPIGVPGELYAGGDGLARGYWQRPELTAEKFVSNPFNAPGGSQKLYRTGDLARFLPDGTIEFLGRIDHQVKIRGFRIELGEIETVLGRHPAIRECVVTVNGKTAGEKKLVAYLVSASDSPPPNASELRSFLLGHLPEYMVPSSFMPLPALPLTSNGKVDRSALPAPDQGRPELERQYVPPGDEVELQLARIWETVLNVRPVGIQDKFFDLGGHSLLAVRLIAQIEKAFGRKLRLATIFQAPTVQRLAAVLRQEIKESSLSQGTSIVEIQSKGSRPALFLVHGAGGGMFWGYVNLSQHLGPNQPVYGFKSRGLDGREELDELPKIAAEYVADLRKVQPHGPYYLGGYCFGGIIAYEMARQIAAAGDEVRYLGLLNCAPPNSRYTQIPWTARWGLRFLRNLVYWGNYCRQWTSTQRREFVRWKWSLLKRRLLRKRAAAEGAAQINAGDLVDLSAFTDEQRRVWEAHIRALINYHPAAYPGRVHLYRSPGHPLWCSFDPDYGWGDLAQGGVEINIVPGAHEKILEEGCVEILAGEVSKALERLGPGAVEPKRASPALPEVCKGPSADFQMDGGYAEQFEKQARRQPAAVAVSYAGNDLTYGELDARANRLAHFLQNIGAGPEVLVGVCLDRSLDLAVALLGVAKSGGAYLPLDPEYPAERLAYMLADSRCSVLLTHSRFASALPKEHTRKVICLDELEQRSCIDICSPSAPESKAAGKHLAYVIYTSGSTGTPKGVEITNSSLLNHNFAMAAAYGLNPADRVLQFAPLSLDISVEEIFPTWISGGTLVLRTEETISSAVRFLDFIRRERITVLNLPTAFWHELVEFMHSSGCTLPSVVRLVVIGGEKVSDPAFLRWKECIGGSVKLINGYGVTEATVTTTLYEARPEEETLPIGRPIANTHTLVLDEQFRAVGAGLTGELFIGGAGVARGYLNRPDLTRQKFVFNPFRSEIPSERLYRTGDLVRLREDGELEYLGRIDDQVIIRGYRIELGEIEAALREHPEIKAAAVLACPDSQGKKRLVAYVVPRNSPGPQASTLVPFLKGKLPAFMVPSSYVQMTSLPLTPAGKIDRHALPPPASGRPELSEKYAAPRNQFEEILADIWSEVLSVSPVGINDSFFDLGGHSLLAIQVLSRIRERLNAEVGLNTLFSEPTIALLAEHLEERGRTLRGLPAAFKGRQLPLSSAQKRIWFLDTFEPQHSSYNRAVAVQISGPLLIPALKKSLTALARRHDALRTIFPAQDGQPAQYLAEPEEVQLPIIDLRAEPEATRRTQALERAARDASRRHITARPMLKTMLFRLQASEHLLVLVLHELAADFESVRVVLRDLAALYDAFCQNQPEPEVAATLCYGDALRVLSTLTQEQRSEHVEYWKRQLQDAPPLLELPTDRPRADHKGDAGARWSLRIAPELGQRLEHLAISNGCSLSTVLLAGFATLLRRYTGSEDIVIGSPISLRTSQQLQQVVGPFENPVALRCDLTGDPSFQTVLERAKQTAAGALRHSALPFADVLEELHPERNPSRTPLFQVMFAFKEQPLPRVKTGGAAFAPFTLDKHTAQVDLRLTLLRGEDGSFAGWIEYSTHLFDQSRMARLGQHLLVLLEALSTNPAQCISTVPLLPDSERELLEQWSNTQQDYPRASTLVDLLRDQTASTPDATALVSGQERLSYRQLWARANVIAGHLRRTGAQPGTLVGVCLERSASAVAALLGTLLSGAAYVPLDPNYPKDRLEYIAQDAALKILITQEKLLNTLPVTQAAIIVIEQLYADDQSSVKSAAVDLSAPHKTAAAKPDDLAYVIYTSGSTGKPKGVALEHRSAVAFVSWARKTYAPEELAGVLASTSICFDLSIFEIFVPLCCGGKIVLAENALVLPVLAAAREVTLINTVPSAIRELLRIKGIPPSVQVVNLAGEPLPAALADQIYAETSAGKVYDLYGPTETTTYSTVALRQPGGPQTIGRPLPNEQVYLLDEHLQLAPVGVPGELYIGGAGLAREYLNRPDLTAERFITNPFATGERLYKTGDLARWREDGMLEYLGRIDHQVKIRGFRIELGEIESVLKTSRGIREAIVIAREDLPGDKRLVAYVVFEAQRAGSPEELREMIRQTLPEYMVPSAFVILERLPLTPNGKIDRKALPIPGHEQRHSGTPFVAPRNAIEEQLARIWCEVLHLHNPGVRDNFFNLGGHSLLAIQVISRIREVFKVELPLFSLFTAPTIAALAEGLASGTWIANETPAMPLQRGLRGEKTPLSFVQERLWFLHQLDPGSHAYNVPAALRLKGTLNTAALERVLNELVKRHEALRTTFHNEEGLLRQIIAPASRIAIQTLDLRGRAPEEGQREATAWIRVQAQKSFDLEHGPLIRAAVASLSEVEHLFAVVMHHTISDGWSLAILLQELAKLYDNFATGSPTPALPELPLQYADFAAWQRQTLQGALLDHHLAYWKANLASAPPAIDLPADRQNEAPTGKAGRRRIVLSASAVQAMAETGQKEGATPFILLMGALAATVSKWTGQSDLVIGTVVAGRNTRQVENLVGCFMNFLPVRCRLQGSETGKELIATTRKTVLDGQTHQDCPFEKMVEAINPERRLDRNPLYNVALLLQNFPAEIFASESLEATLVPVEMEHPLLDLRFEAEQAREGFAVYCEYRKDLFEEGTIDLLLSSFKAALDYVLSSPESKLANFRLAPELEEQASRARAKADLPTIAVTATFTGEPLLPALRYWMRELETQTKIEFAPYSQVFQQLLDPNSLVGRNRRGLNIILLRIEDWIRDTVQSGNGSQSEDLRTRLARQSAEFVGALKTAASRFSVPCLVCMCPAAPALPHNADQKAILRAAEESLGRELEPLGGVHVLNSEKVSRWYAVQDFYDASGDELGHVPYTPVYFTALATAIARVFHALNRPAAKVIAVDCDQTLWSGVCGEDGAKGIRLEPAREALQKFLREQLDAGMLLALCSKNNPEDVEEVFAQRAEMPLRREHFAAARLNWSPKSENLKSLARELNLGLDSFIFIDDNPVECAEVEANCPGVRALQLPEDPDLIPAFLDHCWIFDHLKLTSEDRRRAESYRQNIEREQLREASATLGDFLAGLELRVEIAAMAPPQLARVAQLTQRTNQFNATTRRRTESELQQMLPKWQISTVTVRDRFGEYGLTGAMIYRAHGEALEVDSFMLSCRVLGRGVEHEMLAHLGETARTRQLRWVDVHFVRSAKNKPALDFLDRVGAEFKQPLNGGYLYRFPAGFATEVTFDPQPGDVLQKPAAPESLGNRPAEPPRSSPPQRAFRNFRLIAIQAGDAELIHKRVEQNQQPASVKHAAYAAPHNALENQLCGIWEKLLRVEKIGVHDNFFELGGHSLLAVRLFSEMEKLTGRKLPLVTIFQASTVEQLARALARSSSDSSNSLLVPIQPIGNKSPLFLVHGAGGDVLWGYANLAAHLPPDQPIYGIKSRGQLGLAESTNLPEMAQYYLEALRAFQSEGPYYLGGYCFGGNVAYEMARQLLAAGQQVGLVALLDSAPSNAGYEQMAWWRPRFVWRFSLNFREWLKDFSALEPAVRRKFLARKFRSFGRKISARFSRSPHGPTVDLDEIIDTDHFPENELKLWQVHLQALVEHTDQPYEGNVTLLRTSGQPLFCSLEEDFCWGKLARGGVKVVQIPGSHENIFMEPNVRTLAKELAAAISEASTRSVNL